MLDKFDSQAGIGALDGLMLRQHALFAVWQVSVHRQTLSERTKIGRLHRIHTGVYGLVPEVLLTPNGRRMAAVLACGPGAGLSHYSCLKLRGLMDSSRTRIDVTVPDQNGRARKGIVIHRSTTLRPNDVELVQGIPCTTLARTIFDMAAVLSERRLERLLDEAAYQDVLDLSALTEQILHNRGRKKAAAKLRRVLAKHNPGSTLTDGPLGEEMLALIRSTDLPEPSVQYWIDLDDGEPMIQADFAWPDARLIVETDGQQAHGKARRTVADYRRDQRAARAGWHTLRFTPDQIRSEPHRVRQTLSAVVKTRLAEQARRRRRERRADRAQVPAPATAPATAPAAAPDKSD